MKKCLCEIVVPISSQTTINELKRLLWEKEPEYLGGVDIRMLEVWTCPALAVSDIDDEETLKEHLRKLDFPNKQTARMLRSTSTASSLSMQQHERLLVRLPSIYSPLPCYS